MSAEENGHCILLPGYRVQHWDCSDYEDGTVTSVVTGQVEP